MSPSRGTTIQTPEGWTQVLGPVRSVPTVSLRFDDGRDQPPTGRYVEAGCVTVGNRVRALWQDFGHSLGNGTIVAFEREMATGWIKAVIDYDYPTDLSMGADGFVRWDFDRLVLCTGHWFGETQEESVERWRARIAERNASA